MEFIEEEYDKNLIGIYKIVCRKTKAVYIGQTRERFQKRYWHHKWCLERNQHCNKHLQNAWNKYGSDNFYFRVVEVIKSPANLDCREQFWIWFYQMFGKCYNISEGGGGCPGVIPTEEQRRAIGEKNRINMTGRKASDDTRRKMSESHKKLDFSYQATQLTEATAKTAKEMLMRGMRIREISEELGVSYNCINNILSNDSWSKVYVEGWDDFQSTRKRYKRLIPESDIKKMKEMYAEGNSVKDISKTVGCDRTTVKKYVK